MSEEKLIQRPDSDKDQAPAPSIESLSQRSQKLLEGLAQAQGRGESPSDQELEEALESLKADLDGQGLGLLEESLDWLREYGLYELSVPLLEEAWSAELPLDFHGRVAQDWVGSVLFGLGDERGARQVAQHLSKRAMDLGPAFCNDLCDMWLEWGFFAEAEPLARFVHDKQPGEISALFHLLICAKMRLDWTEASSWLKALDERRAMGTDQAPDPSIEWNRGLLAVAQHDWATAREAWSKVGFRFPDDEGDEPHSDYAQPGELSPVRLKIDLETVTAAKGALPRSEVVWGRRIGPARVELTGIPYFHPQFKSGDLLLIDGVREGKVDFNGETYPVSPALGVWSASPGETFRFYGAQESLKQGIILDRFVQELGERGWAIVHWTRMIRKETPSKQPLLQLALYLPPERKISDFYELFSAFMNTEGAPKLFNPRYAELVGEEVTVHQTAWVELGINGSETQAAEVKH